MRGLVLAACMAASMATAQAAPQTFHLHAPDATQVFLAGEMTEWDAGKQPMRRGADGRWSLTLDLAPGQWVYKFVVDGHWVADPAAANDDDGRGGQHSFVFVGEGDWTERAETPRGRVVDHAVPSAAWGRAQRVQVYLPPGWQQGQPLPVLWLLHGHGMTPDQWTKTGRIGVYLDNLLARGAIRPMAVVLPSSAEVFYGGQSRTHIAEELPLWLAQTYGLRPGRAQSALAGMSMGGAGALRLGIEAPQRFGFSYSLSGAFRDLVPQVRRLDRLPMPLVLRSGSQDPVTPSNRALVELLQAKGFAFDYRERAGGHTWQYWSHEITPMLMAVDRFFRAAP
jgi:enterochelin esterase-like enzyme